MTDTSVGRFQLIETQQLQLPHRCAVCGGTGLSEERKFIDFDLWIEFFGVVYICDLCFRGAAEVVNCVPRTFYDATKQQLEESQEVIKQLIKENKELRDAVDAFRNLSRAPGDLISEHGYSYRIAKDTSDVGNIGITEGEEGSSQQTNEQGSALVHSNDSDESARRLSATFEELGLNI